MLSLHPGIFQVLSINHNKNNCTNAEIIITENSKANLNAYTQLVVVDMNAVNGQYNY